MEDCDVFSQSDVGGNAGENIEKQKITIKWVLNY